MSDGMSAEAQPPAGRPAGARQHLPHAALSHRLPRLIAVGEHLQAAVSPVSAVSDHTV